VLAPRDLTSLTRTLARRSSLRFAQKANACEIGVAAKKVKHNLNGP
jgi:hypothetical protein